MTDNPSSKITPKFCITIIANAKVFPYILPTLILSINSSMGFFRLQTSYSTLPKQVDILSPSIQIVSQNIENSSIREHVKIGLKTANFIIIDI